MSLSSSCCVLEKLGYINLSIVLVFNLRGTLPQFEIAKHPCEVARFCPWFVWDFRFFVFGATICFDLTPVATCDQCRLRNTQVVQPRPCWTASCGIVLLCIVWRLCQNCSYKFNVSQTEEYSEYNYFKMP
jgi:hypothetical protein